VKTEKVAANSLKCQVRNREKRMTTRGDDRDFSLKAGGPRRSEEGELGPGRMSFDYKKRPKQI